MTPEERFERIEQKIEFIANQQAQFSADLQQAREELRQELREREAVMQQQIDQHEKQISALNAAMIGVVGMLGRLADAQARTEEGMRKLEEKGAETEERLNAFITFVERYLSQRDGGQSGEA